MRKKNQIQMPLMDSGVEHPRATELERISQILDRVPTITEMVLQDLTRGVLNRHTGAEGMSAEQVLRAAILKQMEGFSYGQLAFHLVDSRTYRNFCRIGIAHKGFRKSALCSNIKRITEQTWESVNRLLVAYAQSAKVEKGREARIDCTVVETNIHAPTDSTLLWDCVRVLSRNLVWIREGLEEVQIVFSDHRRRAKRRMLGVLHAKNSRIRKQNYVELVQVTEMTLGDAHGAIRALDATAWLDPLKGLRALAVKQELERISSLTERVMEQTRRRVLAGEQVPASEKVVSIFEPHSDIIVKDRRDTYYGHKVCLSGGPSNLITDCWVVEGNPADSTLTTEMLDRHQRIYGRYPLKAALDGGFASKENLRVAKACGVKDVCFAKKRGLKEEEMCRSGWVYDRLRRFRAGIESGISWLKRCFGLTRCTWKSFRSFKSYVWASVISANLLTLARSKMTT
jgi:transposase, IS5 family